MSEPLIARTLDRHTLVTGIRDLRKHCTCGWVSEERAGLSAHREHVAWALWRVLTEEVTDDE